ncbi:MAG: thioredoxin domain-containing protein [Firmicutes bacterium]|nr:thioredoxin domain-containing protein [Bacillota bacterium]
MTNPGETPNELINETSPYLLQHAYNPVEWRPWGRGAFGKAKAEDKPVFLSVGYSTCHWCHVMARESFEDAEVAEILNRNFVPVKVDREERPDIDAVYMSVCMALTGSGGWPLTVVTDHAGKPFFAGTYFPKNGRYGMPGLVDILDAVSEKWLNDRAGLLESGEKILTHINARGVMAAADISPERLILKGAAYFKSVYDRRYGGFGKAPKFPSPHNLLFLLEAYPVLKDPACLEMAEKTLLAMAKGGIFDHIGFGFSRYSTDEKWLAPHFEKMLYDNALLITAYTAAFAVTENPVYKTVAEKTALYVEREMTSPGGGFYSAQDADSDGVEGKYYLLSPGEVSSVLGEADGHKFCAAYDITEAGNFGGKSIPNLIGRPEPDGGLAPLLPKLYEYRKKRTALRTDDKILTAWNSLMIAALADASEVFGNAGYLESAVKAARFLETNLCENGRVFTSFRAGRRTDTGFLDDYAYYIHALLKLYRRTLEADLLNRAAALAQRAVEEFFDHEDGGFYLTGAGGEVLAARPKETYDGALPSGNSVMTLDLAVLNFLTGGFGDILDRQIRFMLPRAAEAPAGHTFFLYAMLKKDFPGRKTTAVPAGPSERPRIEAALRGKGWAVILEGETAEYPLKDGETTYYVCENGVCLPPSNEVPA